MKLYYITSNSTFFTTVQTDFSSDLQDLNSTVCDHRLSAIYFFIFAFLS